MQKFLFAGVVSAVCAAIAGLSPGLLAAVITVTNVNDGGPGSLRDAIAVASPGDEIQFDFALAGLPIVLTTGELVIDKALKITGLGWDQTLLDGNGNSRVFNVSPPAVVTVSMLTVRNGLQEPKIVPWPQAQPVIEEGGGIYNSGTLTLNDCSVQRNAVSGRVCDENWCNYGSWQSTIRGGGVFNSGDLTLIRTIVDGNRADGFPAYGGGIYNSGRVMMIETTISGSMGLYDRASGVQGVGIFNAASASMTILDGSIAGNSVGASQAIHNVGMLALTRTTIAGNGFWRGGGLNNEGTATILDSTVISNRSGAGGYQYGYGGGITNRGSLTLVRSTVSGNSGEGEGGIANGGTLRIINSTIADNQSSVLGTGGLGSVFRLSESVAVVTNSTISGNFRQGIRYHSPGMLFLKNSIIAGNYADSDSLQHEPDDCAGRVVSLGHNIVGENKYCQGLSDGLDGDRVGIDWQEVLEGRDRFGARRPSLADNGGTTTTIALVPGSPAVDRVPSAACTDEQGHPITMDQREIFRPQGFGCDVGAFEFSLPRGAGFWAHQCSDQGFQQVETSELQDLFARIAGLSSAFPECAAIGCDALTPQLHGNDLRARAAQALLGLWLNLETGRLTRGRPVDLPGLSAATSVGEALSQAELTVCDPDATRADLGNAKDIAEALNGSRDDMELAALEYPTTVPPGATITIALGLINMSGDNRNYQVAASGPWPVRLSADRINGLGSGETAALTATIRAPMQAQGATALIRIIAVDLLSQIPLSREVDLKLQVVASGPAGPATKKR